MYKKAIILIHNNQYLIYPNKYTYINKLKYNINKILVIKKILYILKKNNKIEIGRPYLKDYLVKILIVNHIKNKKIIVFKKKRRKGYKKKIGYRHYLTKIKVLSINKKNKKK
ncbi:MAG: 50S ribosomal protein L21 [Candidatus Shikimatogenerans bostrichidophilus]|nr:MAG: 50S ribosomal protein L21 [Candidatus Shikimatogenerans bostrichidophilus]